MGVLRQYGVDSMARELNDKDVLPQLPNPFFVERKEQIVLVTEVWSNKVVYTDGEKFFEEEYGPFQDAWSGRCVLLQKTVEAGEPNYKQNRRKEKRHKVENILMYLLFGLTLLVWVHKDLWKVPQKWESEMMASWGINLLGVYLCFLLIRKTLRLDSAVGDKICGLFGSMHCADILETPAAKIGGVYSLAECGFAFFLVNFFFLPASGMPYVFLCALPFTVWSVWYQGWRAKTWCPLCLLVQALVWGQTLLFIFSFPKIGSESVLHRYDVWDVSLSCDYIFLAVAYLFSVVVVHRVVATVEKAVQGENERFAFRRFKSAPSVFNSLLASQPAYAVEDVRTLLRFGNLAAPRGSITVISNPYCVPCAKMHQRLEALVSAGFEVDYVLSTFSVDMLGINRRIVAYYRKFGADRTWKMLTGWYAGGKTEGTQFFCDALSEEEINTVDVSEEVERHMAFVGSSAISGTPTVLVNGRELPEAYQVEDLIRVGL